MSVTSRAYSQFQHFDAGGEDLGRECRREMVVIQCHAAQGKPPVILYEEPDSQICSLDIEASTGQDIMCATDQECLVYLSQH